MSGVVENLYCLLSVLHGIISSLLLCIANCICNKKVQLVVSKLEFENMSSFNLDCFYYMCFEYPKLLKIRRQFSMTFIEHDKVYEFDYNTTTNGKDKSHSDIMLNILVSL